MLLRIVLVGTVIAALLIAVKDQRLLQRAHMVGVCTTYAQAPDNGEWRACYPGRLAGRPSLELDGCTDAGRIGDAEVWRCPAHLAANDARQ